MGDAPGTPPVHPPDLGMARTILAAERTLLAWVRTALSMIGFGFTIYKFFEYLKASQGLANPNAPRNLGLTLVALGTLTLVFAAVQHRLVLQRLGVDLKASHTLMPVVIAMLLALLGVGMLVSLYFRTGPF